MWKGILIGAGVWWRCMAGLNRCLWRQGQARGWQVCVQQTDGDGKEGGRRETDCVGMFRQCQAREVVYWSRRIRSSHRKWQRLMCVLGPSPVPADWMELDDDTVASSLFLYSQYSLLRGRLCLFMAWDSRLVFSICPIVCSQPYSLVLVQFSQHHRGVDLIGNADNAMQLKQTQIVIHGHWQKDELRWIHWFNVILLFLGGGQVKGHLDLDQNLWNPNNSPSPPFGNVW